MSHLERRICFLEEKRRLGGEKKGASGALTYWRG